MTRFSNGANFCCQIFSIIVVFYCLIFFREDTVKLDPEAAFLYILWLSLSVFGLSLAAGQAIYLNHTASILCSVKQNCLKFVRFDQVYTAYEIIFVHFHVYVLTL